MEKKCGSFFLKNMFAFGLFDHNFLVGLVSKSKPQITTRLTLHGFDITKIIVRV